MATTLGLDRARPDRIIDTDPLHWIKVRSWTCPRGAAANLAPARGDSFPDDEDGAFGFTLDSVEQVSRDAATEWLVSTYLKPKVLEGESGDVREMYRKATRYTERGGYAHRLFVGAEDGIEAAVTEALTIGEDWPGEEEEMWGCGLRDIQIDHDVRPGVAYVKALYKPTSWGNARPLEDVLGQGILEVAFIERHVTLTEDLDGEPINKVFLHDGGVHVHVRRWHVVKGKPEAILGAIMVFRIRVVLASPPLTTFASMVGHVNSNEMTAFGDCGQVGYLLMLPPDPPAKQLYYGQDKMLVTFQLAWCGEPWNETVESELQQAKAIEQPIYYDTDTESERHRVMLAWEAVDGFDRHKAKIAEPVDMGAINGYLT